MTRCILRVRVWLFDLTQKKKPDPGRVFFDPGRVFTGVEFFWIAGCKSTPASASTASSTVTSFNLHFSSSSTNSRFSSSVYLSGVQRTGSRLPVFVSGQGKRGKVWVLNLFWTWILHGQVHQKMLILEQKRRCKWTRKKTEK
jgi:hypothetical protein